MALSFAAARRAGQAVLCPVLCLSIVSGAAQGGPGPVASPGHKLKAAYLYRVATFVDWPDAVFARAGSPLLVGVAGDDALADEAGRFMAGRAVHGRPLAIRRVDPRALPPGLHVLYVAASPARRHVLEAVRSQPVLTVCDGAPDPGCVVGLVADGDHLRLRIDRLEATAAQLRISARLLALATWRAS